jgi:hypothetical protein
MMRDRSCGMICRFQALVSSGSPKSSTSYYPFMCRGCFIRCPAQRMYGRLAAARPILPKFEGPSIGREINMTQVHFRREIKDGVHSSEAWDQKSRTSMRLFPHGPSGHPWTTPGPGHAAPPCQILIRYARVRRRFDPLSRARDRRSQPPIYIYACLKHSACNDTPTARCLLSESRCKRCPHTNQTHDGAHGGLSPRH